MLAFSAGVLFLIIPHMVTALGGTLVAVPDELLLAEGSVDTVYFGFINCTGNDTEFGRNISLRLSQGLERNVQYPRKAHSVPCLSNQTDEPGVNVTLRGLMMGFTTFEVFDKESNELYLEYPVGVTRPPPQIQDKLYIYGLMVLVVIVTFTFGISLDLNRVKKYVRKPIAPAIGMVCQFILMPLLGYLITTLMTTHQAEKLGLFAAAVAPGSGFSNIWCFVLNGDLDLSITMTFISTIASLGFLPLWMYTLGQHIIGDSNITLPFVNVLITLAMLIVPLTLGLLTNKCLPRVARKLLLVQKPAITFGMLVIFPISIWANFYAFKMVLTNYQLALSVCLLPYAGGLFGFLVALACKQGRKLSTTIGIETAIQNINIAIILLRTSLPQPWADISSAIPVSIVVFTVAPFPVVISAQQMYLRFWKKREIKDDHTKLEISDIKLSEKTGEDNPAMVVEKEEAAPPPDDKASAKP